MTWPWEASAFARRYIQLSVGFEEWPWEGLCDGQWPHMAALRTCSITAGAEQQHMTVATVKDAANKEAVNDLSIFPIHFKFNTFDRLPLLIN